MAPITGPMYQLFVFFMVTDPKTTVRPRWAQCLVVFLVGFVEMLLRLAEVVYAPFYALFLVGPAALATEMWLESRARASTAREQIDHHVGIDRISGSAVTSGTRDGPNSLVPGKFQAMPDVFEHFAIDDE